MEFVIMPLLSFQSIMSPDSTNNQHPRRGLQRSASIAGITSFTRQGSRGRRLLRNHPYLRQNLFPRIPRGGTVSRQNSEEGSPNRWALHKTRRTQTNPKISHKMKGSQNRALDTEQRECIRSWQVSQVASMLQCSLNLTIDLSSAGSITSDDKTSAGAAPTDDESSDVPVLCNHPDSFINSNHADSEEEGQSDGSDKKSDSMAQSDKLLDTDKEQTDEPSPDTMGQSDVKKIPFTLVVPNQIETIQMPTPPIVRNINLGGLFTTQAHPRALAIAEVNAHNAVHIPPEVDFNNNQLPLLSDGSDEEDMDEGFVADDETDDAQIWAPGFEDVSLWSCLYQGSVDIDKKKKEDKELPGVTIQSSDAGVQEDAVVPCSLRRKDTVILLLDELDEGTNSECDDPDALVCDPRSLEEEDDGVLRNSFSEFRRLVHTYRDFCCWVCGSQMETMNLFDMLVHNVGETPASFSAAMMDRVDLYCPQCDCVRWVSNSDSLLSQD